MKGHIVWIQKQVDFPFKSIKGLTLRKDWPEKREKALDEIKKIIKEGNESGKVIVISNRLYGSGPYKYFLEGLKFDMNGKGLAPHPNLTLWLEKGIESTLQHGFSLRLNTIQMSPGPSLPAKVSLSLQ